MVGWQVLSRPSAAEGGGRRTAFTGPAIEPYSATEVDGWQHELSRVSQNRPQYMTTIYTAAVTLLAFLIYLVIGLNECRRGSHQVQRARTIRYWRRAFRAAYRVQMNTLEQMAFFPSIFVALRHNGYLIHPPPMIRIGSPLQSFVMKPNLSEGL